MADKAYEIDEWKIIERGFSTQNHKKSESIFSLGNGKFGQRANFEEHYSGSHMQGTYIAGVYYPDKTRVGWWKNGYPEYFAKVLNAPSWNGIDVYIDGHRLDLAAVPVSDFVRELDMKSGVLRRSFTAQMLNGKTVKVRSERFISIVDDECACISYKVCPIGCSVDLRIIPSIDADVKNEDSNYKEQFWENEYTTESKGVACVLTSTKKTGFVVGTAMKNVACVPNGSVNGSITLSEKAATEEFSAALTDGEEFCLNKYVCIVSSLFCPADKIEAKLVSSLEWASCKTFDKMLEEQQLAWSAKWQHSDILIEGDSKAQQAIRFNIFQLNQTYTGSDERLNIGPKGFTGEKYGGSTYWDTEAYCFPFYMSTARPEVAQYLLRYRHRQLGKAIENAAKLGFTDGAALYPMVTMNGEECHNEWEITFEEIHRNGAIAYAIYDYTRYTGDTSYLFNEGIEVLTGIARFWAQRANYSADKKQYVILGVTGPNEYDNNVNNNWYTNYLAKWCLEYAASTIAEMNVFSVHTASLKKLALRTDETDQWLTIAREMYLPYDPTRQVFLQNDGFLDKELRPASSLPAHERPINQHWSWDRILRSCFIKQADVVQGMYFFEDHFSDEDIRRNFDFYEPMTVHESSLSPCIYSAVASKIGNTEKAYELYLRTSRLDLDDYNKEADEGLHITSMAGTWISIVKGFAGMRITDEGLSFTPALPHQWQSFSFKIMFRGADLYIKIMKDGSYIEHCGGNAVPVVHCKNIVQLTDGMKVDI